MSWLFRLGASFWRATLAGFDATRKMAVVQVKGMGGQVQSEIEYAEPYGFASRPVPGDDVEVFGATVGAASDHPVALSVAWREKRPVDLGDEDVTIYNAHGERIWLKATGAYVTGTLCDVTPPAAFHGGVLVALGLAVTGGLGFDSLAGGGISGGGGIVDVTTRYECAGVPGLSGNFPLAGGSTLTLTGGLVTGVT